MSMNPRKPQFLFFAIGLLALSTLSSCMVGPNYERPVVEVPDVWQDTATAKVTEGEAPLQTWWDVFDDPKLTELIQRAQASNLDLAQAVWRIQESRAIRGIAKGELLPNVQGTGDLNRQDPSKNVAYYRSWPTRRTSSPLVSMRAGSSTFSDVSGEPSRRQQGSWGLRSRTIGMF